MSLSCGVWCITSHCSQYFTLHNINIPKHVSVSHLSLGKTGLGTRVYCCSEVSSKKVLQAHVRQLLVKLLQLQPGPRNRGPAAAHCTEGGSGRCRRNESPSGPVEGRQETSRHIQGRAPPPMKPALHLTPIIRSFATLPRHEIQGNRWTPK
jgi:hypothetical protein